MMSAVCLIILLSMFLAVFRSIKGPTVYDRILSVNAFGTLTVVLISVYGFLTERPDFLDLALVYALINFIGTIAASKYVEYSHIGRPTGTDEQGDI